MIFIHFPAGNNYKLSYYQNNTVLLFEICSAISVHVYWFVVADWIFVSLDVIYLCDLESRNQC